MRMIRPITMVDSMFISSTIPETDTSEWVITTAYTVGNTVMVTSSNYHYIYRCQVNNTGKFPPDYLADGTPATWKQLSRTNRWRMWDDKVGSPSTRANTIIVTIRPAQIVNSIALLDVAADAVTVQMTDPVDGIVYDESVDMVDLLGIDTPYAWFFEPLKNKTNALLLDLPAYPDADIEISIDNTGDTAKLGEFIFGTIKILGDAAYPYNAFVDNYSKKGSGSEDDLPFVDVRKFLNTVNYNVNIDASKVQDVKNTIGYYLNTPAVYIGYLSDEYVAELDVARETVIFGYVKSFNVSIDAASQGMATAQLSIEELV